MTTQEVSLMSNWDKVMTAAKKYGFIVMASGGVAVLMAHEVQKEQGIFEKTQKICKGGKYND